jgi:hypothetical protein
VKSFHRLRIRLSAWHTDERASGGRQRIQTIAARSSWWNWGNDVREDSRSQAGIARKEPGNGFWAMVDLESGGRSVAGELDATGFDGFGEAAADEAKSRGRGIAFRLE